VISSVLHRHIGVARLALRTGADRDPTARPCCIAVPQTAILVVVNDRGALIDRATQTWVQATGQEVDLHEHRWLAGPTGDVTVVADDWLGREAHRLNGSLVEGGGLLPDFSALSGDDFNPSGLAQPIIDFYERTAEWRLEVWSQWCGAAWPFGWLISALFARRLNSSASHCGHWMWRGESTAAL
jgi:hypothetical protein